MLRLGHNYLAILTHLVWALAKTVLSALPCTSPVLYHSHLPCTQLDSKWISEPIWLNISKKHILVRRLVPAQKKSARKSHNAVPNGSCITATLKTASECSYTYAQSKTAQSLQLAALLCFYPPKVRFILDLSLNAMHHAAATHTHTLAQN